MLLSYTKVDFHLFYDAVVDIQIWAPLTRSQCKVSDTQVTIKACGSLVLIVDAEKMVFEGKGKEADFLFTCCEGMKISLHSWYSLRNRLADEVNKKILLLN